MTDWRNYLTDKDTSPKQKRPSKSGCKRNRIARNRYGPCTFNDKDECIRCNRPRKKVMRLDPVTNTIIVEYYE